MAPSQPVVLEFPGKVRNGKLLATCPPELTTFEGRRVHVAVRLETAGAVGRKPTRKQRGYYFAVVCQQFGEHCGTSRNETHQALKLEILGRVQPDNPFSPIKSIRTLPSPQAFVDYVDQCVAIAGRFGCELPPPDPAWRVRGYLDEWQTAVGRAA